MMKKMQDEFGMDQKLAMGKREEITANNASHTVQERKEERGEEEGQFLVVKNFWYQDAAQAQ